MHDVGRSSSGGEDSFGGSSHASNEQVVEHLWEKGYGLSLTTLRRESAQNNNQRVTVWNHPPLTETQRQQRLDWCLEHRHDPFENDIFTAEKIFRIGEDNEMAQET